MVLVYNKCATVRTTNIDSREVTNKNFLKMNTVLGAQGKICEPYFLYGKKIFTVAQQRNGFIFRSFYQLPPPPPPPPPPDEPPPDEPLVPELDENELENEPISLTSAAAVKLPPAPS